MIQCSLTSDQMLLLLTRTGEVIYLLLLLLLLLLLVVYTIEVCRVCPLVQHSSIHPTITLIGIFIYIFFFWSTQKKSFTNHLLIYPQPELHQHHFVIYAHTFIYIYIYIFIYTYIHTSLVFTTTDSHIILLGHRAHTYKH